VKLIIKSCASFGDKIMLYDKSQIVLITFLFHFPIYTSQAQINSFNNAIENNDVIINVNSIQETEKAIKIEYEIINNLGYEVWICEGVTNSLYQFETFMEGDGETITIRKRYDLSINERGIYENWSIICKFVRLGPSDKRIESLSITLPVFAKIFFTSETGSPKINYKDYAKRIILEIGYYSGSLPDRISEINKEIRKEAAKQLAYPPNVFIPYMTNIHILPPEIKDDITKYGQEKSVYISNPSRINFKIVKTEINNLKIPYDSELFLFIQTVLKFSKNDPNKIPEEFDTKLLLSKYKIPDLNNCTRIEIQYEPSMLDYFYPLKTQQALLSTKEKEYLETLKDLRVIKSQINPKNNEYAISGTISPSSRADLICYEENDQIKMFTIYNESTIENNQQQRIYFNKGLTCLRSQTMEIQPFEKRLMCAANLQNLWQRMRFYEETINLNILNMESNAAKIENFLNNPLYEIPPEMNEPNNISKLLYFSRRLFFSAQNEQRKWQFQKESIVKRKNELKNNVEYLCPDPADWCDSIEFVYQSSKTNLFRFPSAEEVICNYAMNPNCKHDSPGDMVLLFETKDGWNQHGGPELFTFDNHDPKGGCVLFNNGTVKFIRTKEEVNNLRWQ
jgi:hypothetical protein